MVQYQLVFVSNHYKKLTYITVNMRWLLLYTAETKKRVLTRSIKHQEDSMTGQHDRKMGSVRCN